MLSINKQCQLLNIARSLYYYEPHVETEENLMLMRIMDEVYTEDPTYGRRRMTAHLRREGHQVNPKRVKRLMNLLGIEAIYPKPRISQKHFGHKIYPYLLRNYSITKPMQVWSSDITYIRMAHGFAYLTAVMDWFSRYVISWQISNTLDSAFCLEALQKALESGVPEIFNTDQGVQYTSKDFTKVLEERNIQISMDGKGRALDNIFIERLWRTVKYEHIYLYDYQDMVDLYDGLNRFFFRYNNDRLHQSLGYKPPIEVHCAYENC